MKARHPGVQGSMGLYESQRIPCERTVSASVVVSSPTSKAEKSLATPGFRNKSFCVGIVLVARLVALEGIGANRVKWDDGKVRLFLSHLTRHKVLAQEVKGRQQGN